MTVRFLQNSQKEVFVNTYQKGLMSVPMKRPKRDKWKRPLTSFQLKVEVYAKYTYDIHNTLRCMSKHACTALM